MRDIEACTPVQESESQELSSNEALPSGPSVRTHTEEPRAGPQTERIQITQPPPKVTIGQVEEGWGETYKELRRRDEKMVQEYREEIDTLLVFVSA
jgi:hypothetical protein